MVKLIDLALRRCLVACLAMALTLAGVNHVLAALPATVPTSVVIAGTTVILCAADPAGPDDPGHGAHAADCDQCSLCAAVALPPGPSSFQPLRAVRKVEPAVLPLAVPHLARLRTPRLSQGPPSA